MARDVKLVQHGTNVQGNDLAVPAGTPLRAVNIDYQRDGIAQRRNGFDRFDTGLPWASIDPSYALLSPSITAPINRGVFELFSRDRSMLVGNGCVFQYEETVQGATSNRWFSVPVNLPHRYTLFGRSRIDEDQDNGTYNFGIGRAVVFGQAFLDYTLTHQIVGSALRYQAEGRGQVIQGTPGNSTAQQQLDSNTSPGLFARFYQVADAVNIGNDWYSDFNCIRSTASILAGSLTVTGSTNGTGTAATFNGASWMSADSLNQIIFVADNTNQIRKVTSAGVVTTFAGSITSGDVDGLGTAARFRGISGLAYDGSQFLYVVESGGSRVRKCDITTGSVTIFAGALTPTPGYVDATGTAARFSAPVGIEYVDGSLYVGDSTNGRIRKITTGAVVTTYAGSTLAGTDGLIGGAALSSYLPGVVLRGVYDYGRSSDYFLAVECTTSDAATMDVGLVRVTTHADDQSVYHIVRCPSGYPDGVTGPNKFDTVGPNAYGIAESRGTDVGSGVAFTTSERPRVIDTWTRFSNTDPQPRFRCSGVLAPEAPSVTTATGTTFAPSMTWAYRTLCGLSLPDGRIVLGPPSERIVVVGSFTGTVAGSLTAYPSPGLPYDGLPFVQVYRTRTFDYTLDPGDQMFLCYEASLSYGAGLVVLDELPDALLGAELYTNATADGSAFTALPPPYFANEAAAFQQQLVVSNYIPPASARLKVLGTGGLSANTTVDISNSAVFQNRTLRFVASASATDPGIRRFQIASGGTPAQNAVQTARNLAYCINRCPDSYYNVAAYDEGDPGTIVISSLFPGKSKTAVVTKTTASVVVPSNIQSSVSITLQNVGTSIITIGASDAARQINGYTYSEQNAFDSFPAVNNKTVGPATEGIVRTLPISDSLLFVKDDSCWRTDNSFTPQIYDVALTCSLPNSFARVNNQWIGLFTRGFVSLNSSQAIAIGRPMDRDVTAQYGSFVGSMTADFASAAAIDVSGNYLCTFNRRTYCYNAVAQAWSEWQINTLVRQYSSAETVDVTSQHSGMLALGAFRDSFISTADSVRSVYRQRDFRRDLATTPTTALWYRNFSDSTYSFSGVLSANKLSVAVSAYNATVNPGVYPPYNWIPPVGAVDNATNNAATFAWVLEVTQGSITATAQGTVAPTTLGSATSPVTITLATAASSLTAGSVTVVAYAPIICRVQYAPFAAPGSNAQFGGVLVTAERAQPGWMIGRFFNRRDFGDANIYADGPYTDDAGVSRALIMPSLTSSNNGLGANMAYHDVQRFAVPSERATDQILGVELWEGNAWQPFAIKVVSLDKRPTDNEKIVQ